MKLKDFKALLNQIKDDDVELTFWIDDNNTVGLTSVSQSNWDKEVNILFTAKPVHTDFPKVARKKRKKK